MEQTRYPGNSSAASGAVGVLARDARGASRSSFLAANGMGDTIEGRRESLSVDMVAFLFLLFGGYDGDRDGAAARTR